MATVLRLGWFIWVVSEFETPAPAFRRPKPPVLPEARIVNR